MTTISIELSDSQQKFVDAQIAELGIPGPEEYLEKLIQEERKRKLGEYYMKEIQKGLDSGDPLPMDEAFWERLDERIRLHREEKRKVMAGRR